MKKRFTEVRIDGVLGLRMNVHTTLALNVTGLVQLLSLSRQLRRDNCYYLKFIKIERTGMIPSIQLKVFHFFNDQNDIS